jgi:Tol biopolymer transport system component
VTEDPYPIKVLTADPHEFTLACPDGLAVLSRGDAQPTRLLSEYLSETYPVGWSPDGKRLAMYLSLSGQSAVVDFGVRAVLWPTRLSTSPGILGWAADTVIAYQTQSQSTNYQTQSQSTNSSAGNPILTFYDFADPERGFPELSGIQQYVLSPDKSLAAAILPHRNQSGRGQLALMPALGSSLTLLDDDASSPTWSPSGDALAYVRVAAGAVSLNLANPTTVMTREVWSSQESGLRSQSGDFQIVWSPTGKLIALTSNIYSSNSDSWIILMRPDGSGVRVLTQQEENAASYPSGFSADGKYFAVTRLHPRSWILSTTLIYDTATGDIIRTLSNMLGWTPWSSAWSPTGHEMVLNSYDGVYLLADPGDPNSQPDQLTGARCFGLMWNPRP